MDQNTLIVWGISVGIGIVVSAFIRFVPKQKLMNKTGPMAYTAGKVVSAFGNSKIGKSAMDKVEEGILATIIAVVMNMLVEFGRGLNEDK